VRLGSGQALDLHPDGTRVVSVSIGEVRTLVVYPTGPGESRRIELSRLRPTGAFWTGRGEELLLLGSLDRAALQAFLYDPVRENLDPVTPEDIQFRGVALHPKLRLVAARVLDGPLQLYSLNGDEPRTLDGIGPRQIVAGWSDDGRELYLAEAGRLPAPVVRYDLESGRTEPFLELMPVEPAGLIDIGPVSVTPTGDAYLYSYRRHLSTLYLGEGYQH
jgi:hypothetical protein